MPSIVTNITVPLLGFVDLSIVGHLDLATEGSVSPLPDHSTYIGAIAIGTLVFNMVYWLFNFLRMGSSGLTAQAFGRNDLDEAKAVLRMALRVALACGLGLIALQLPIEWGAKWLVAPSNEVWTLAMSYFRIRIWSAPAVLSLFALNGWFIGMQNSRFPMWIAIGQNCCNIALSAVFVFGLGMGIQGVALGTVVADYLGLLAAYAFSRRLTRGIDGRGHIGWHQFFSINRDIFFRMICLIAVTSAFSSIGARLGDTFLAIDTLLLQFFTLFSYFSDGFALAGEALAGRFIGARERQNLLRCVRLLFLWGGGVTLFFTSLYALGGEMLLRLFTKDQSVILATAPYQLWAILIPVCGIAAFIWDGIYVGATATRPMLLSLFLGAVVFFSLYFGLRLFLMPDAALANHLLWISFLAYLLVRGVVLSLFAPKMLRDI